MWFEFRPYVSVGERLAKARREVERRRKKGQVVSPITIEGRKITTTFWGDSWCKNLESYSDFSNRLPRGRSYVRNGSVVDLQINAGKVTALVMGSELYEIKIDITAITPAEWKKIKAACAGSIGSLVELLQGKLSRNVMDVVTNRDNGLFPKPREIKMSCSCPDYAGMCKHLAATMYGVGARLDMKPELLFRLRGVDHLELIQEPIAVADKGKSRKPALKGDLADVFGIDLAGEDAPTAVSTKKPKAVKKKPVAKKKPTAARAKAKKPVRKSR